MSGSAPGRLLPGRVAAGLVGLAAALAGLGMPGHLLASTTISCGGLLTAAPPQRRASAQLGWAIAVGQTANQAWLAAGANQEDANAGSVYLFPDPAPPQTGSKLVPPSDLQPGDQFGTSVSIDGNWLAVGAPLAGANGGANGVRESGAVYLFLWNGSTWVQEQKLAAADAVVGARFGFSVSLRGATLAVGAPGDSGRGSLSGSVYVFARQGTSWQQAAKPLPDDGRSFDELGSAVAVAGDEIVVGAPFADDLHVFQNFGAAYVFKQVASGIWDR